MKVRIIEIRSPRANCSYQVQIQRHFCFIPYWSQIWYRWCELSPFKFFNEACSLHPHSSIDKARDEIEDIKREFALEADCHPRNQVITTIEEITVI